MDIWVHKKVTTREVTLISYLCKPLQIDKFVCFVLFFTQSQCIYLLKISQIGNDLHVNISFGKRQSKEQLFPKRCTYKYGNGAHICTRYIKTLLSFKHSLPVHSSSFCWVQTNRKTRIFMFILRLLFG